ncbi:MAG: hypothetical protein JXA57_03550 [Armatimonadetes bacterium]|nr:hypothetical protein [Armatimonadota bacterium]
MNTPKYLLAKYISDLRRVEPRNIGVIVWSPQGVGARFTAEKQDRPGEVDGRSIPSWVTSSLAYKQWVQYWQQEINKDPIQRRADGALVPRRSPEFTEVLAASGKGNFVLVDGGFLLDPIEADGLQEVVDHLFGLLVEDSGPEEPRDATLDDLMDGLIQETVRDDPHFKSQYRVDCSIAENVMESFEFSHCYGNGAPLRLYQRVPFSRKRLLRRKTVDSTAWMFEKVIKEGIINREQGGVIVNAPPELRADPEIERSISVLGSVTRVLDLQERETVVRELASLPSLLNGHD